MSKDVEVPPNNGAVHNIAKIIKVLMSSAAEAARAQLRCSISARTSGSLPTML